MLVVSLNSPFHFNLCFRYSILKIAWTTSQVFSTSQANFTKVSVVSEQIRFASKSRWDETWPRRVELHCLYIPISSQGDNKRQVHNFTETEVGRAFVANFKEQLSFCLSNSWNLSLQISSLSCHPKPNIWLCSSIRDSLQPPATKYFLISTQRWRIIINFDSLWDGFSKCSRK